MPHRFSGHESFPFRYPWLPKAINALESAPGILAAAAEDEAMVELGVGKNMVRSIKFWAEATGLTRTDPKAGTVVTPLGKALLGRGGFDPYLEDIRSLWILHWNITALEENALFAWEFMFNRWQEPDFTRTAAMRVFKKEAEKEPKIPTDVTLDQHFSVFLHTYLPRRSRRGEVAEENLDCPMTELELLVQVGERESDGARREPVYAFRRDLKPTITPELFAWAVNDFFVRRHAQERTVPVRALTIEVGSPGQLFKLPEEDLLARVAELERASCGLITYQESAALPQVQRAEDVNSLQLLHHVFNPAYVS
jgi:Protein of unknown function (DUF4007)